MGGNILGGNFLDGNFSGGGGFSRREFDGLEFSRWEFSRGKTSRHVFKTSSRRLQGMSLRRLEDVFSVTIFRLPRRLGRRKIVKLKTC